MTGQARDAAIAPGDVWCEKCQGVYGRGHAKVAHRQAGLFGWRDWTLTHRVVSQMYVLGLISGSGAQGTGHGWRLTFVHFRGSRPYILGMQGFTWGRIPLWHRLRFGHWPETVWGGMCGVCAPWPCCGATGFDHEEGCTDA